MAAPVMSASASNVEKFSRGEAIVVEVDRIERELAALWQAASRGADAETGGAAPVARAALWNLIITAHGAESLATTKRLVDDLAPSVPARVITLCRGVPAPVDATATAGIRATIESNVVSRPDGARVVHSEEITLAGDGAEEAHFGALVRSLQIPSLPTATLWIDSTAVETLLTNELLPVSDRLVVDTGRCGGAGELAALCRLAAGARPNLQVADLGWLRLAGFRLLFAGLFDPPVGGGPLLAARRIVIQHRTPKLSSGLLLAAWLGCQLGWNPVDASAPAAADGGDDRGNGGDAIRLQFAPAQNATGGGLVAVDLVPSDGECGTSGIVAIALDAPDPGAGGAGGTYAVRRTADNHAEISVPIAPVKSVKLDSRPDAELCVGALGRAGRDPLLRKVLPYAGRLADLVAARRAG
jgi:glucose-6-phosphate dehydrogenase assembly protein OpcA